MGVIAPPERILGVGCCALRAAELTFALSWPQSPVFSLCLFFFVAFPSPPFCQAPFYPEGFNFLEDYLAQLK